MILSNLVCFCSYLQLILYFVFYFLYFIFVRFISIPGFGSGSPSVPFSDRACSPFYSSILAQSEWRQWGSSSCHMDARRARTRRARSTVLTRVSCQWLQSGEVKWSGEKSRKEKTDWFLLFLQYRLKLTIKIRSN